MNVHKISVFHKNTKNLIMVGKAQITEKNN